MCEREQLLRKIQICNFATIDAGLYLDSHPTCQNALDYFEKHKKMRDEAVAEYNCKFGPLTASQNMNPNLWTWVEGPWPWELEG